MKKHSAFTLIELLIVVAIIAILAAIAVPNFLEAQVRAKVSRTQADMRSLATAIESYAVDHQGKYACSNSGTWAVNAVFGGSTVNGTYALHPNWRSTFQIGAGLHTLTTPMSYITSYPPDPFASTKGSNYGYNPVGNKAFILWSFGPDCDEVMNGCSTTDTTYKGGGQVGAAQNPDGSKCTAATPFNWAVNDDTNLLLSSRFSNPTATLLVGGYTYDSTNGSKSWGDVYRVKQ